MSNSGRSISVKCISLLIVIVWAMVLPSYAQSGGTRLLKEGIALFDGAKFRPAIEKLELALSHSSLAKKEKQLAHLFIGFSYAAMADTNAAEVHFRQVLKSDKAFVLPERDNISPKLSGLFERTRASMSGSKTLIWLAGGGLLGGGIAVAAILAGGDSDSPIEFTPGKLPNPPSAPD